MPSKLPPHLRHLTDELPANRRADVEESILSSDYLQRRLSEESVAGRTEHIRILPPGSNSGGHYDEKDKSIYIDADLFTEFKEKPQRLDRITYVLGHEVSHSAMTPSRTISTNQFNSAASAAMWTETDSGYVDLTKAASDYLRHSRRDEALSTVSAWNAVADRVDREKPGPITENDVARRVAIVGDCVTGKGDNARLEPGIILDERQRIGLTKPWQNSPNLEAVAQCYYDDPPKDSGLGAKGTSDYTNRYGTAIIEMIDANIESYKDQHGGEANSVRLNFKQLGLDPQILKDNGLNLSSNSVAVFDISDGLDRQVSFQNSGRGKGRNNPEIDAEIAQAPKQSKQPEYTPAPMMSEPGHPAHAMYSQALNALRTSSNIPAGTFTEHEEQKLAAGIVAQALTQNDAFPKASIDHVVMNRDGTMVIGVQGPLDSPANRLAGVNIQQALSVSSIEQSSDVARTAVQSLQQKQEQAQVQAETLGVDTPTSTGPTMRIGARTLTPGSSSSDAGGAGQGGGDGGGGGGGGGGG